MLGSDCHRMYVLTRTSGLMICARGAEGARMGIIATMHDTTRRAWTLARTNARHALDEDRAGVPATRAKGVRRTMGTPKRRRRARAWIGAAIAVTNKPMPASESGQSSTTDISP